MIKYDYRSQEKYLLAMCKKMLLDFYSSVIFSLHSIVATPGRFLHIVMEMELKLNSVEYVVFDEADRYV